MVSLKLNPEGTEWIECAEGEKGFVIDGFLKKKLDNVSMIIEKNWDAPFILVGDEGCLTGDTLIQVNRYKLSRKYTLQELYLNEQGLGHKRWKKAGDNYIRAFNGKEIKLHKVKQILFSGIKKVFNLELIDGKQIKATANHKFLTRNGWKRLDELKINEELMCDNPKTQKSGRKRVKLYDIQLKLDYHPYSMGKKRIEIHRLIYESRLNNFSLTEYLDILLNEKEKSKELKFIDPSKYHIHHIDGCHYNNSTDNLQLLTQEEHLKYHSNGAYQHFSQGIPIFVKIKSIKELDEEKVYDIQCEEPHHNFVANGIVVHNSGKSTLGFICAQYLLKNKMTINNIAEGSEDAIRKLESLPNKSLIVVDEAELLFSSRETMSKEQRQLTQVMKIIRQKNMTLILISPVFFDLSKYIAVDRSKFLLRTYTDKKLNRGFFMYWGKRKKIKLYHEGKKTHGSYSKPKAEFTGRFPDYKLPFDDEYQKLKARSLKEAFKLKEKGEGKGKLKSTRDDIVYSFYENVPNITFSKLAQLSNLTLETVKEIVYRRRAEKTPLLLEN